MTDHHHACPVCYEHVGCDNVLCDVHYHEDGTPYGDIYECEKCEPYISEVDQLRAVIVAEIEEADGVIVRGSNGHVDFRASLAATLKKFGTVDFHTK